MLSALFTCEVEFLEVFMCDETGRDAVLCKGCEGFTSEAWRDAVLTCDVVFLEVSIEWSRFKCFSFC